MDSDLYKSTGQTLELLLSFAWLALLAGFAIEIFAGYWSTRKSKAAAYLAVLCIFLGVYPQPIIQATEPDIRSVVAMVQRARDRSVASSQLPVVRRSDNGQPTTDN